MCREVASYSDYPSLCLFRGRLDVGVFSTNLLTFNKQNVAFDAKEKYGAWPEYTNSKSTYMPSNESDQNKDALSDLRARLNPNSVVTNTINIVCVRFSVCLNCIVASSSLE